MEFRRYCAGFLALCMTLNMTVMAATPVLDNVASGDVSITQGANSTIVDITSQNAVLNWNNMDTMSNELLRFNQTGADAAVLNRIISANPTQFFGALEANGRVFIVNPAGVIFGAGSTVNVAQLTASSLKISDQDFLKGDYIFDGGTGSVINYGTITADKVALIGKYVKNAGTIVSNSGYIIMAAGDKIILSEAGGHTLVELEGIDLSNIENLAKTNTGEIVGDVINEGTITANGGDIVLAAGDIVSRALGGIDDAALKVESGYGRVAQLGNVSSSSPDGGDGGSVTLTAGETVVLGDGSVTSANAGVNGDGGQVIVYSPENALFRSGASIEAWGGSASGDGGYVDVSGKEYVEANGSVDLTAANGERGTFLIDPYNLMILDNGVDNTPLTGVDTWGPTASSSMMDIDTLNSHLDNSNVTLSTAGQGNISFMSGRQVTGGAGTANSFTVTAGKAILFADNSGIDMSAGTGNVTLNAGTFISSNDSIAAGGDINLNASTVISTKGDILAGGNLTVNAPQMLMKHNADQTIASQTAAVTINSDLRKDDLGNLSISGLAAAGSDAVVVDGTIDVYAGNLEITADAGDMQLNGDITAGEIGSSDESLGNLFGGVHVETKDGKIYTYGTGGELDISVTTNTDTSLGQGVALPFGGKTGISIISTENLALGSNASFTANGAFGSDDDRAAIDFRDSGPYIGEPIDVAIYLASTGTGAGQGNVSFDGLTMSMADGGTAVVDAYDTVSFKNVTFANLFSGHVDGGRLEVASRITHRLQEAKDNDTLPFADQFVGIGIYDFTDGTDGTYVLRGGFAEFGYDGAWVLYDLPIPPPSFPEYGLPITEEFEMGGCPALMQWAAGELNIDGAEVQIFFAEALANAPEIDACDMCSRLKDATEVLADLDGARIAAVSEIVNTYVQPGVPFAPEMAASITQAIANNSAEENTYAMAGAYVDAVVAYVAILDKDLGWAQEDALAFFLEKRGTSMMENENADIASYVLSRLELENEG